MENVLQCFQAGSLCLIILLRASVYVHFSAQQRKTDQVPIRVGVKTKVEMKQVQSRN